VSSPRSNSLPVGYFLRLATLKDSPRVFYFQHVGHTSTVDKISLILLFLLLSVFLCWFISLASSETRLISAFISIFPVSIISFVLFIHHLKYRDGMTSGLFTTWLVEHKNTIHGYIGCVNYTDFIFVYGILVCTRHRNKGIGSFLLAYCQNTCRQPIYLVCTSQLKNFYYHRGFVDVNYADVPNEISGWRRHRKMHLMVFQEMSNI
jgi:N-acetylglutamate synthase-like GNAT family acetyltransferase